MKRFQKNSIVIRLFLIVSRVCISLSSTVHSKLPPLTKLLDAKGLTQLLSSTADRKLTVDCVFQVLFLLLGIICFSDGCL